MNPGDPQIGAHSNGVVPTYQIEASGDKKPPVSGVVNRVMVPTEREPVVNDPSIGKVMLSIDGARKLADLHNETAETYFREDQTVITTTTVHDSTLKELDWRRELDIIRRFGPDYHIPTEYSVYQRTMSPEEQGQAISDCMEGTEWMAKRLQNHSTTVLVQAKGWLPWHYEMCQPTLERLGTDFVVFYAVGYEAAVYEPKEDIENLISTLNPSGILIIGKQSTRFLRRMPPEVVAAAGCRWRKKSGIEKDGHNPANHERWKGRVEQFLGSGQTMLDSYFTTRVKENG